MTDMILPLNHIYIHHYEPQCSGANWNDSVNISKGEFIKLFSFDLIL